MISTDMGMDMVDIDMDDVAMEDMDTEDISDQTHRKVKRKRERKER